MKLTDKQKVVSKEIRKWVRELWEGWHGFIYVDERKRGWIRIKISTLSYEDGQKMIDWLFAHQKDWGVEMYVRCEISNLNWKRYEGSKDLYGLFCVFVADRVERSL